MNAFLLDALSIGAVLSGIMVITAKNPVISVLFLIAVFVNVAGYLVLLGVAYLGLVYLIVYVGAIAILFLFVIMMLNLRLVELIDTGQAYTKNLPIGAMLGSLFLFELLAIMPASYHEGGSLSGAISFFDALNGAALGAVSAGGVTSDVHSGFSAALSDSTLLEFTQIESIGQGLYTYSALWLMVAGVIFLLAMVGPIVLSWGSTYQAPLCLTMHSSEMQLTPRSQFQAHPFHLVTPSPWPLLTSFALLILTIAAAMYFNGFANGGTLLALGFVSTVSAMILWFRDVVAEGTLLGNHTFAVQKGLNMGVALFIVSEIFFFISIFWAYFHSALAPTVELGTHWPPAGIDPLNPFEIPLLNTILLLSSGASVTYAHHSLIEGNRRGTLLGIIVTVVLALIFTALQGFEYYEAPFTLSDGAYGSTFFFATGFHGIHVMIGTAFIAVAFFRILSYHLTDHHHLGFEASILYWHFVDVVWLFLYVSIYWWGA
ncbi:cytochrome c oxidase subunit 3 (mitochondrion) [Pseudohyphozyma bogoriensis]|nr:cytochrome c oxidase subunit 3 [Pseudohyphozyma bogoriensis]KAI5474123.1 cytochrome c oxidase subunit 3 [Pseudohyphozyma bogoriensis]KAI5474136.1 cytochrome c oxidase subunit 3 [Pseudohyphozyma bogoriensis]